MNEKDIKKHYHNLCGQTAAFIEQIEEIVPLGEDNPNLQELKDSIEDAKNKLYRSIYD